MWPPFHIREGLLYTTATIAAATTATTATIAAATTTITIIAN